MKYIGLNEDRKIERRRDVFQNYYYFYKINNSKIEIKDEAKFDEVHNNPISLEYEFSKKFQLKYTTELIENAFKISVKSNISITQAVDEIQINILKNCWLNLDFANVFFFKC